MKIQIYDLSCWIEDPLNVFSKEKGNLVINPVEDETGGFEATLQATVDLLQKQLDHLRKRRVMASFEIMRKAVSK